PARVDLRCEHAFMAARGRAGGMRLPDLEDLERYAVARLHGAVKERDVPVVAFERNRQLHAALLTRSRSILLVVQIEDVSLPVLCLQLFLRLLQILGKYADTLTRTIRIT